MTPTRPPTVTEWILPRTALESSPTPADGGPPPAAVSHSTLPTIVRIVYRDHSTGSHSSPQKNGGIPGGSSSLLREPTGPLLCSREDDEFCDGACDGCLYMRDVKED